MSVPGSLIIVSTPAFDRAIAISSADRVASSITCPPDDVCDVQLRSCRVALMGTEIVRTIVLIVCASAVPTFGA
jgi:hypothetical protein